MRCPWCDLECDGLYVPNVGNTTDEWLQMAEHLTGDSVCYRRWPLTACACGHVPDWNSPSWHYQFADHLERCPEFELARLQAALGVPPA